MRVTQPNHLPLALVAILTSVVTSPVCAQIEVRSPSILELTAAPGAKLSAVVELRNTGSTAQDAHVYLEDYRFFADGRSQFESPGTLPRSNASWIRLSTSHVTLEGGETAKLVLSIDVPNQRDSLVGSYWSLVIVEPIADGARDATSPADSSRDAMALRTRMRHAIQVVTHLGETGHHDMQFASSAVSPGSVATRTFAIDVLNSGERAYRPAITLEVYGSDGAMLLSRSQQRGLIYPGTSVRQAFEIDSLGPGEYTFLVVADTHGPEVFGARFKLRF